MRAFHEADDRYVLWMDVQDCTSPEDFVVVLSVATREHQSLFHRVARVFEHSLDKIYDRVDSVGADVISVKFRDGVQGDWRAKGNRVIEELAKADKPVILMVDELPVMVNRLLRTKNYEITDESRSQTEVFLSWFRKAVTANQGKLCWVVCGSIGLNPVLSQADLNQTVAHLRDFPLSPWEDETADECLEALAFHNGISLDEQARAKMLELLGCNIPHYVQMFFGHVTDHCRRKKNSTPTVEDIQTVYDHSMLSTRGHAELADLEERLHRVLGRNLAILAMDLLTQTSVKKTLTEAAATGLADYCKENGSFEDSTTALRTVMDVLRHDGYLRQRDDGSFEFVSRLVRDWWKRRNKTGFIPIEDRGN